MSTEVSSSNASVSLDEKHMEATNGNNVQDRTSTSLNRTGGLEKETEANIVPEREGLAEADLEKEGGIPSEPVAGGTNPADFPDGGLEAWLVVFGAWCTLFCSFGWINAIGTFQEYYQLNTLKQYSSSTVSWITSMELFVMFMGGPFCGKVFDSYGPQYLMLVGTFLHVFGLMMTSLSSKYYQIFLSQGVVSALGASMVFNAAQGSTGTWFFKKRGAAFGIMASGSSLGGVIFPIMVPRLIAEVGFPWAMRACAFLILGMLAIANFTVKSRLTPRPSKMDFMQFIRPLKQISFLLTCVAGFFFFFGTFLPFNYVALQAQELGMSKHLSQYLLAMLNAASIFGRILPGIAADKVGRFNVMIITCAFSAIIVLAMWLPARGNAPIIVFSILYGFSSGAFVSLGFTLIAQISDIRDIGVRIGTFLFFTAFAGLTGNPIGGALVGKDNGSYLYLQVFCGVTMAVGTALYIWARYAQVGWKWKVV
ncbi:major facilitator superfamily domain-containing protein [Calycina marina]|uniref:Major facilitator superfamily domain-containing protein n=1 Tax=Calycina marina TaxID=1763456 RepID=A0A9P7Z553_9HELO|nr:major facilitator superfamily domain-containing protein [Calycina marina]